MFGSAESRRWGRTAGSYEKPTGNDADGIESKSAHHACP
jgi:hypothetical protein